MPGGSPHKTLGPPPMWTRTGTWSFGAATSLRSSADASAGPRWKPPRAFWRSFPIRPPEWRPERNRDRFLTGRKRRGRSHVSRCDRDVVAVTGPVPERRSAGERHHVEPHSNLGALILRCCDGGAGVVRSRARRG